MSIDDFEALKRGDIVLWFDSQERLWVKRIVATNCFWDEHLRIVTLSSNDDYSSQVVTHPDELEKYQ